MYLFDRFSDFFVVVIFITVVVRSQQYKNGKETSEYIEVKRIKFQCGK